MKNTNLTWLTLPGASEIPNCALQFHGILTLAENQLPPRLHICAESFYVLYLNGNFVGRGTTRGSITLQFYDEWDTTPYVHAGVNHLAVLVQSMNQRQNFNTYPAGCALGVDLGEDWRVRKLPGWENTTELFTMQHGYKVSWDLRQHGDDLGWCLGAGVEQWPTAVPFSSPLLDAKQVVPRDIPALREEKIIPLLLKTARVELATPQLRADGTQENIADLLSRETWDEAATVVTAVDGQSWQVAGNAALIYDFGQPATGFFACTIEAPRDGIQVELTYGEELWHGRVRAAFPLVAGTERFYLFTDSYILHAGTNHIWHPFEQHGAKLLQIEIRQLGAEEKVTVSDVHCHDYRYPYLPDAAFHCSDPLLERIWTLCCNTMRACTTDVFVDCPWREHAFWVNDLIVENRTSLAIFGPSAVHRHALRLAFSQKNEEGWITAVVPNFEKGGEGNVFPATNFFIFRILDDYLMASGDWETVRSYLPQLKDILEAAEKTLDDRGLVGCPTPGYNFIDWAFENGQVSFNGMHDSILNSLYISALKLYQKFAGVDDAYAQSLNQRLERSRRAMPVFLKERPEFGGPIIEDTVFDTTTETEPLPTTQLSCELAQALALSSGIWEGQARQAMIQALKSGKLMQSELYLTGLVLQTMGENGLEIEALDRIRQHWGRCVAAGYDTIPECAIYGIGREVFWESGSLCHGFATGPVVLFQETILGVRAVKPGFAEFTLNPRPADLTFASGYVHTPHGAISVKWHRCQDQQGKLQLQVDIPGGCTAILSDGTRLAAGHHCLAI